MNAITGVCEKSSLSGWQFADFTTREKTAQIWISIQSDQIAMDLLPKARTKKDYICLQYMVGSCMEIADEDNNCEVIENLEALLKLVKELKSLSEPNDFSDDFLSAAIAFARQNLKENADDKMWKNIGKVFREETTNNNKVLREIFGFFKRRLAPQQIKVPNEIEYALKEGNKIADKPLCKNFLKNFNELDKINTDLVNLPEMLRPFLTQESGKQMVLDLRNALIRIKVHPTIVKAYLDDEQQIVNRLYYHADLDCKTRPFVTFYWRVESYIALTMNIISNNYRVVDLGFQSDSFSASCDRYQKSTGMTWREQIADELFRDAEYQTLAGARIKEQDWRLKGFTLAQYFQWIKDPQSPIGFPELKMLSKITGRSIVIVRLEGNFIWVDGINFYFDKKPFILNVDKKGIWGPVKQSTQTLTLPATIGKNFISQVLGENNDVCNNESTGL